MVEMGTILHRHHKSNLMNLSNLLAFFVLKILITYILLFSFFLILIFYSEYGCFTVNNY